MSASQYKPEEDPVYLLFKRVAETAGPKQKEGYSFRLRVEKGGAVIDFETQPPPIISGGKSGFGWTQQKKVTKQETENALRGYEEYVGVEETGDKIIIRKKKTFDDATYQSLKMIVTPLGFRWMQGGGGWEAQKK